MLYSDSSSSLEIISDESQHNVIEDINDTNSALSVSMKPAGRGRRMHSKMFNQV